MNSHTHATIVICAYSVLVYLECANREELYKWMGWKEKEIHTYERMRNHITESTTYDLCN